MYRVEIIPSPSIYNLQNLINSWFKDYISIEVVSSDICVSSCGYVAMITYKEDRR